MRLKSFAKFINESETKSLKVFHSSTEKINSLTDRPMWFTLNIEDGLGFYDNRLMDGEESFLYSGNANGNFADMETLEKLFNVAKLDLGDYIAEIVGNPDEEDVMDLEGTDLVISKGYDGIIYPDYNPWDSQEDIDVILIFKPKGIVSNFAPIQGIEKKLEQVKKKNGYE